jgi:hypothetical protein
MINSPFILNLNFTYIESCIKSSWKYWEAGINKLHISQNCLNNAEIISKIKVFSDVMPLNFLDIDVSGGVYYLHLRNKFYG